MEQRTVSYSRPEDQGASPEGPPLAQDVAMSKLQQQNERLIHLAQSLVNKPSETSQTMVQHDSNTNNGAKNKYRKKEDLFNGGTCVWREDVTLNILIQQLAGGAAELLQSAVIELAINDMACHRTKDHTLSHEIQKHFMNLSAGLTPEETADELLADYVGAPNSLGSGL
ncbi:Hypothetical predicted protein [Mytilus galloprovincialis]|uniref:Uncharacterized protein n=1 Tax=Mytilus galloprovincialis TaxID=29158 RepID=A0A8B6DH31_MYTGA|nr:Hypothetical predicted protein [Mytilus galloprovincialis]